MGNQFQAAIRSIQTSQAAPATPAAPAVPPPPAPQQDTEGRMMERFLKMQPLTFAGISKDTLLPVKWVKEMEKAFEFLGCNDQQKLICARYKLQYEAEAWWETTKPILQAAHLVLTWDIFKQAFFGNYFPTSVRKRKEIELAELVQGSKSVLEYQQKFEELFFFAPLHLGTDEAKAQKFEDGLRPQIASIMATRPTQGYSETVQTAKRVEDKQRDAYHVSQSSGKRATPFPDRGFNKYSRFSESSAVSSLPQRSESETSVTRPVYANPSTKVSDSTSTAPSSVAEYKCFTCGQMGHTSRTCHHKRPMLPPRQPAGRPQGRVYSVTVSEAKANQAVVTGNFLNSSLIVNFNHYCHAYIIIKSWHIGTILICDHPAYTLFDTGATHSFVSPSFAKRIGVLPKSLSEGLAVSTPTGSRIDLNTLYEPCAVRIAGRIVNAHLILLDMTDFDVILGMDWLSAYKANVLCAERKIVFQPKGKKGFIFMGDKKKRPKKMVISALEMKKLLNKGCQGYLVSVLDTRTQPASTKRE
ncbi:uncharacterized protein LOC122668700 [Telopea speciosissima]|uniref:uncharacterized protein LOC122668700 n=1 Tax=Telopea speciosissima TaxID=54955 RepID=UPI001CC7779E|nr:uncharacterized protein LOC122668700 [Telopea speciosissima]